MKKIGIAVMKSVGVLVLLAMTFSCTTGTNEMTAKSDVPKADPLPSWNEGTIKSDIIAYVEDVTNETSPNFIPVKDRIATFDNDGTLWSEQPMYFQLFFAIDRVKALAPDHPEWKDQQPFKAVLENDKEALLEQGVKGILEIVMTTLAGLTEEEFSQIVTEWIATAQHPEKKKIFTDLVFQPMLELLHYLRANEFETFIVSGGGIDFMRPWTEEVYGVPRHQVVGSSSKIRYEYNDGNPVIIKLPEMEFIDDKEGKPEGIQKFIGRKPVFSAGNSDGDLQMLRWADSNDLKSFKLYVHHTDSVREWAYDRKSHIGTLDKGLDEANEKDWAVVDMARDWKVIYPFEMK